MEKFYGEWVRTTLRSWKFDTSFETLATILPRARNYESCEEEKVGQGEKMSHTQLSILTRKRQARGVKGHRGRPLSLFGPSTVIFLSAQAGI